MKIFLTGKNGQVGWELHRTLLHLGKIITFDRNALDLSDPETLRKTLNEVKPDIIVNAAAYTAVDKAEEEESLAMTINGDAPAVMAEEAKKLGALLVHYSTDYVFSGEKDGAYTENDAPCPLNAYGRSKLAGEQLIQQSGCDYLIFRTSWVYASRGANFLLTMLRLAQERDSLSIVGDQYGSPTWARHIAGTTSHCIGHAINRRSSDDFCSGLFHLTSSGSTSWHGFSETIIEMAVERLGLELSVSNICAIPTVEYPTPAERPKNSCLSSIKIEKEFKLTMPDWKECLDLCIEGMK